MDKQEVEGLLEKVTMEIGKADMKRDAVMFSEVPIYPCWNSERCFEFNKKQFDSECSFQKNNWEVNLNYAIRPCAKIESKLRGLIKRISRVVLSNFAAKQNEINYGNSQCWRQMQLYIDTMQKENELMKKKQEIIEQEVKELRELLKEMKNY